MKKVILTNRALPLDYSSGEMPARIHIVPRGELFNKEAGVTQVLDDKALDSILADLKNRHAMQGGLYMGEEHFIYDSSQSSQAFAWGKEFGMDDKGIWTTKFDSTDVGELALKNKRFKFTSFVADPETPGAVENLGNGRVRILKIDTVGFTNFANGKERLTPIQNRESGQARENPPGIPSEALTAWFTAVQNMQSGIDRAGGHHQTIYWNQAWNLCKKQHPELYIAAFGSLDADPYADPQTVAAEFSKIANRVKAASGCNFHEAWNFSRDQFPKLFNRMSPPPQIENRQMPTAKVGQAMQRKVCNLIKSLTDAEQRASGGTFERSWNIIRNRHQTLFSLAHGQITPDEAFAKEPTLRNRLS